MTNKLQKGFIFRQENCVGCGGCTVACQIHNELPEDVRFRKVDLYEVKDAEGRVRDVWLSHACMHCTNPSCMAVCPANCFTKRPDGIVVLDRNRCTGCGLCKSACPMTQSSSASSTARLPSATSALSCLMPGSEPRLRRRLPGEVP